MHLTPSRHCKRSEVIQPGTTLHHWIASSLTFLALLFLTACTDTTPTDKAVTYDQATGTFIRPQCPDWSQPSTANVDSSLHSNFGCAYHNNIAVQLANPADLARGRGTGNADTEGAVTTITRYRAGEIPEPLEPMQATGGQ